MSAEDEVPPVDPPRAWRPRGLLVIFLLVASGVGVTAGYMQWKAPEVGEIIAGRKRDIAAAPQTPEGRLRLWLEIGAAQIHHHMTMMRYSAEQPWLVTHAVGRDPAHLAIHGIDLESMPKDLAWIEGPTVHLRFPKPRLLAIGPLTGDNAVSIPVAATDESAPDEIGRARYLVDFALHKLAEALERDIPGARLSIEIGPEATWAEIAADRRAPGPSR